VALDNEAMMIAGAAALTVLLAVAIAVAVTKAQSLISRGHHDYEAFSARKRKER
jgi:hypothetical protein